MKKAQILSAITLAFALGVVAPVAGVYAEDGIMPLVDTGTTTEKSATNDNLKSAVNYVTSNATYKAFATWTEAKEAATATGIKEVTAANTAVTGALANFDGSSVTRGNTVAALNSNIASLKSAIGSNYNKYVALYNAMNADASKIGSEAAINGVASAMKALGYTFNIEENDTFDDVKTAATEAIDNDADVKNYSVYSGAIAAINDGEATIKAFSDLKTALQNSNLGLSKTDASTVNDAQAIATLTAITPDDATEWAAVATKITDIEAAIKNENGTTNTARYELLDKATDPKGLLQLMQAATGNDDLTYDQLISAASVLPTDPSNPSDDDNKGDDDNKTPTTPGTGIVSTAEGSASTTISIVAGLATALTALGAGVVAYRNARRSGEK